MRFETSKTGLKQVLEIAKELKEWFTPEGVKDIARDFKAKKALKAVEGKKVLCFAVFEIKGKKLEILWIAARKDFQGKGIGSSMLEELEKKAAKKKLEKIIVKTAEEKKPSKPYWKTIKFYEANGFKKAKILKNYWKDTGNNAVVLEKALKKYQTANLF